jgi:hypothetical protein
MRRRIVTRRVVRAVASAVPAAVIAHYGLGLGAPADRRRGHEKRTRKPPSESTIMTRARV